MFGVWGISRRFHERLNKSHLIWNFSLFHLRLTYPFFFFMSNRSTELMCISCLIPAAVKAQPSNQQLQSARLYLSTPFLFSCRRAEQKSVGKVPKVSLEQQKSHMQKESFHHNTSFCAGLFSSRAEVIDYCVFDWQNQTLTRFSDLWWSPYLQIHPACFWSEPHFRDTRATRSRKGRKLAKIKKVVLKVM